MKILLVFSLFWLGIWGCSSETLESRLPDMKLESLGGMETPVDKLADEQAILLVFWATWCTPCIVEIPSLVRLHKEFKDRGLRVVSINVDSDNIKQINELNKLYSINYEVLLGGQDTMRKFGGVTALPTSFLVQKGGKIMEKLEGLFPERYMVHKIEKLILDTPANTRS